MDLTRASAIGEEDRVPLRISIDPDRCMGSGSCTFHAPGTFDVGEDNVAVVLDPAADPPEAVRRAADGCPTQAITVEAGP